MKLHEVSEGRGAQVLSFNIYLGKLVAARYGVKYKDDADIYKQVGIGLFKEGFVYDPAQVQFTKFPEEGGVYEITYPHLQFKPNNHNGREGWEFEAVSGGSLGCVYYNAIFNKATGNTDLVRYDKFLSLQEVKLWTVPTLLKFMKEAARPRN